MIGFWGDTMKHFLPIALTVLFTWQASAATIRVPADRPTIQEALDAAVAGDTVLVAPGEYLIGETLDFNRLHRSGDPGSPPLKDLVLKSEGGAAVTAITMGDEFQDRSVVAFTKGETGDSVLEGFTLTGGTGHLEPDGSDSRGGGILCDGASPRIQACRIAGNRASLGGGIFCRRSAIRLIECAIEDNLARLGGGIFCDDEASPSLFRTAISRNAASLRGYSPNTWGGGAYCSRGSAPLFEKCSFRENTGQSGAALHAEGAVQVTLRGCAVLGNIASYSSAVDARDSTLEIEACTLSGNCARAVGGINLLGTELVMRGTIVWGNLGRSIAVVESEASISFSCMEGPETWEGTGNIAADPLFAAWGEQDEVFVDSSATEPGDGSDVRPFRELASALSFGYALAASSPCIGTGPENRNMGAELGVVASPGKSKRIVHIGRGSYSIGSLILVHHASLAGAGNASILEGRIFGLRTGSTVESLRLAEEESGIVGAAGEAPEIRSVTFTGSRGEEPPVAIDDASPRFSNCIFTENRKVAISCRNSSPSFTDCTIAGNSVDDTSPAAIFCTGDGSPTFNRCIISGNGHAGLVLSGGSAVLIDCHIASNPEYGIRCLGASPTLTSCRIIGSHWGIVCEEGSSPSLKGCRIAGNHNGIIFYDSSPILDDCVIQENSSEESALRAWRSSPRLSGCTIARNSGTKGALLFEHSTGALLDCIVWGNAGGSLSLVDSTVQLEWSCIEGAVPPPGTGNISSDPLFCGWTDAAEVDIATQADLEGALSGFSLALAQGSPCIGAGKDGKDMGARLGTCASPLGQRKLRLAAGTYRAEDILFHGVKVEGTGDGTVLEGTVAGLGTGDVLSRVAIRGGRPAVLIVDGDARIEDCRISEGEGPGIHCAESSSPVVTRSRIVDNLVAGIRCLKGSAPSIEDCTISGNVAGIHLTGSSPSIARCTISANLGRGIDCTGGSSPAVTDCSIDENGADGLSCTESSSPVLARCAIAGSSGYGVSAYSGCSPSFTTCDISHNWKGGLYASEAFPVLVDCLVVGNRGHAVYSRWSSPSLSRCTLAGNVGDPGEVVIVIQARETTAPLKITNSIVWDNAGKFVSFFTEDQPFEVSYSCIQGDGVWPGTGNIASDPLFACWGDRDEVFVDASASGDGDGSPGKPFRDLPSALEYSHALTRSSPCLGAGSGGANMGADRGIVEAPGSSARRIRLGEGTYSIANRSLVHRASIIGQGAARTTVVGTVEGLRTGSVLSAITVTGGVAGGVVVRKGEEPEIRGCTISGNRCDWSGGGLSIHGSSPRISDCTVSGNTAPASGGGIVISGKASPSFTRCSILGNWAGEYGGGIFIEPTASILSGSDLRISANWALRGGGIFCTSDGPTRLERCLLIGNRARDGGAGIWLGGNGSLDAVNCAFIGNHASWNAAAAAGPGELTMRNCTVADNVADRDVLPPAVLASCIVWGNTPATFTNDKPVSHSCLEGGVVPGPGNISEDPLFVARGKFDAGLPDPVVEPGDYRLRPGSPAREAGDPEGAPGEDLEGNPRPCGQGVDMGAYEDCAIPFRRGDAGADGKADITDAVVLLGFLFLGDPGVLPCLDAADSNDSGVLNITDPIILLLHFFLGGPPPPDPFAACGIDGTPDALTCISFPPCE
jgi:parallel beta-helix repeat protein